MKKNTAEETTETKEDLKATDTAVTLGYGVMKRAEKRQQYSNYVKTLLHRQGRSAHRKPHYYVGSNKPVKKPEGVVGTNNEPTLVLDHAE